MPGLHVVISPGRGSLATLLSWRQDGDGGKGDGEGKEEGNKKTSKKEKMSMLRELKTRLTRPEAPKFAA